MRQRRKRNTTWIVSERFPPAPPRPERINHFGCSGGKDSTALLLWALFESGYERASLDVSFCDTGNESTVTTDYVRYLEDRLQIGITWIKPEKDFFELAKHKKRFPSARARFCTEELKIIPTTDYINATRAGCKELMLHSGVRAAESAERAELAPESYDARFGAWVKRPLLKWKVSDVWAIHERYGVKPNPLYAMGLERVGCFPCVMCRKVEVRKIVTRFPDVIDKIKAVESDPVYGPNNDALTTFFHGSKVPIIQRSKSYVNKKGEVVRLATIEDVARWSQTDRGGVQGDFDFDSIAGIEHLPMGENARSCPSSLGMCE